MATEAMSHAVSHHFPYIKARQCKGSDRAQTKTVCVHTNGHLSYQQHVFNIIMQAVCESCLWTMTCSTFLDGI